MSFEFVFSIPGKDVIVLVEKIKDEDYCRVRVYEIYNFTVTRKLTHHFDKVWIQEVKDFLVSKLYGFYKIKFNYLTSKLNSSDFKTYDDRQITKSTEKFCCSNNIKILFEQHNFMVNNTESHEYQFQKIQKVKTGSKILSNEDIKNFVDLLFTFLYDVSKRENNFDSIEPSKGLEVAF